MKTSSFLISISGSSGVGKTTLAKIISYIFQNEEFVIITGDNFHKWERGNENWNKFTHLNPDANNLDLAFEKIKNLKNNESIFIDYYDHSTGKFKKDNFIESRKFIIYEGLHALYDDRINNISDLSIFVDTEQSLTDEWKIKRDTSKRGYSRNEVENQIQRRKYDQKKYIDPQKTKADLIASFGKTSSGKIKLDLINKQSSHLEIIEKISIVFDSLMSLMQISNHLMMDSSLIQGRGGNISVKYKDKFIVKSSGSKISDINISNGFVICNRSHDRKEFQNEEEYNKFIMSLVSRGDKPPSMETGFHNFIPSKIVIHTHPTYLNCILCSTKGEEITKKLFSEYSYRYIPYVTPGYKLCNHFIKDNKEKIFFLENHGLIVALDDLEEALRITEEINNKSRRWIEKNKENFIDQNPNLAESPLFPDAAIFKEEMRHTSDFILNLINYCNLSPKFLKYEEQVEVSSLKSEKYRKSII
jgi:uridine kinase/ribulose-5-phosphate 4-epimerase/fuculose-1-phosphate aldolase